MNDATTARAKNARIERLRERMKQLAYKPDATKVAALSAVVMGLLDLLEDEL